MEGCLLGAVISLVLWALIGLLVVGVCCLAGVL